MPLTDLLWACPACGTDRGLQPDRKHSFVCRACATRFHRERGGRIAAVQPDGHRIVRDAWDWVDRLPSVDALVVGAGTEAGEGTIRTAEVDARVMTKTDVVREGDRFLNRIEVFGPPQPARLALTTGTLELRTENGDVARWTLDRLTAVQASSRTLQVKAQGEPLLSVRFRNDSILLWELLLQAALLRFYERTGRGHIVEFQPRIVTGGEER